MQQKFEMNRIKILRLPEVSYLTSLSRSTLYEKMNIKSKRYDPKFPKTIKLGVNAIGWYEHEINQWIESKALERGR